MSCMIDYEAAQSAAIVLRAVIAASNESESLSLAQARELLDDARAAYRAVMFAQGLQPEKAFQ